MERVQSVNGFIGSLPRIVAKKIWRVVDENGAFVQCVSATDNLKRTAQEYINTKYPGQTLTLTFSHTKGYVTIPR